MRTHRAEQARAFAEAFGLAGRSVVEIGCGRGYALDLLAQSGMMPTGVEWGGAAAQAETQWPIVDAYPTAAQPLPCPAFAAFVCYNFLEHAPDPRDFLLGIAASLEPAGVGLIEVPSYAQQRVKARVFDYVVDHVSYFDDQSLALAVSLSGFTVERLLRVRDGENIEAWVRRRTPLPLEADASKIDASRYALADFLSRRATRGERVAVWGASHQALTMLAGVPVHCVAAIIDSAPFKQGRFAPVSRLPIVAPTAEALHGLAAILIIAAGYEREIVRILRDEFDYRGDVFSIDAGQPSPLA
jgi:SAM-dependent methyltransferase